MTTKVNPAATTTNTEMVGRDLQFITLDYTIDISGSAGPNGAQKAVLDTLMTTATIVAIGPLLDTGSQQTFAVEGGDSIVVGTMQTALQALGTVDGKNLGSTECHATKLGILDGALVS